MGKIIIEGNLNIEHIKQIGKLVCKMFKGKKEHVNMFVVERTENLSIEEIKVMIKEIWK